MFGSNRGSEKKAQQQQQQQGKGEGKGGAKQHAGDMKVTSDKVSTTIDASPSSWSPGKPPMVKQRPFTLARSILGGAASLRTSAGKRTC